MNSVLFIVRNFPPDGGPGVQRALKFVRYLPQRGWRPIVITGEPRTDLWPQDPSLLKEIPPEAVVIRCTSPTPRDILGSGYRLLQWGGRLFEKLHPSLNEGTAIGLLGWGIKNVARQDTPWGWLVPATEQGLSAIRDYACDAIYSTSYPVITHEVAYRVRKISGLPWIADIRDPLIGDPPWFSRSDKEKQWLRSVEDMIVRHSSCVINAHGASTEDMARRYLDVPRDRFRTILNGYDPADVEGVSRAVRNNHKLTLRHIGTLYKERDITDIFDALSELKKEGDELANVVKVELYGKIERQLEQATERGVSYAVSYRGYVRHDEVIEVMASADVLLLVNSQLPQGALVVPGKLYEYLASGTPILLLGPKSCPAAQIINDTGAGLVVENGDIKGIRRALYQFWEETRAGTLVSYKNDILLTKYQRSFQSDQLAKLLNELT